MKVRIYMIFMQFAVICTFLFSVCGLQSSQQKFYEFDIEAQYLAQDHAINEGNIDSFDKLNAIKILTIKESFQRFSQPNQKYQSWMRPVEKSGQDRTALWQGIMNDVLQDRKNAYNEALYLKTRENATF